MPTRREIYAREIRAPARIASRTVRSLRSRRSVGVALRANALARVRVEHVRRVVRARPQPHPLAALGCASRLPAREEPRRATGQLGAAEDEGVRAELLDHLHPGVE